MPEHDMGRPATKEETALILNHPKYEPWVLATYDYWKVYLNIRDPSLFGRAYAWYTPEHIDRMQLYEIEREHLDELIYRIIPQHRLALGQFRRPLAINCEWQGNETDEHRGHGHMHLLPRYAGPVHFGQLVFTDPNPTRRHVPRKMELSREQMLDIVDVLQDRYNEVRARTRAA